jgi:hypothetical protein
MCVYKVAKVVERSRFLCGTGEVANGDRDLAFVECDMRCARSCDLRRVNTVGGCNAGVSRFNNGFGESGR